MVNWGPSGGYDRRSRASYVAGLLSPDGPDGTTGYVVAKRSEFVSYDIRAFLERMNDIEEGWGGGSTVGGAPRRPDGRRSGLSTGVVLEAFREGLEE